MNIFKEILSSEYCIVILFVINIIVFVLYFNNYKKLKKYKKDNEFILKRLGNGNDILELLKENNKKVEKVEIQNKELSICLDKLNFKANKCLQKVGFVRYNAFKDTGSELSFALAILDNNDTGIVLNGIYSRETSNIYAKSIINGKSEYRLSEEEIKALKEAIEKTNEI